MRVTILKGHRHTRENGAICRYAGGYDYNDPITAVHGEAWIAAGIATDPSGDLLRCDECGEVTRGGTAAAEFHIAAEHPEPAPEATQEAPQAPLDEPIALGVGPGATGRAISALEDARESEEDPPTETPEEPDSDE